MIFGAKERFAVECEVDSFGEREGSIFLWIGSAVVGSPMRDVHASHVIDFLHSTSLLEGTRNGLDCKRSPQALIQQIEEAVFGDHPDYQSAVRDAVLFKRYLISDYGVPSFDSWRAILVECDVFDKAIWRGPDTPGYGETLLKKGEFTSVIAELVAWARSIGLRV